MKLMKVFDISEFSEAFQKYILKFGPTEEFIAINLATFMPNSDVRQELLDKGCELDETILINS
jgi:hypothetical protein